ncbi:MAG: FHA domain-containing protein [Armatimonadetes bacterium]|nr:MAG: FHA domain-containing protein [Armatimonadota bacterium]
MTIFLMFLVGGAAGLLGWAIMEPSAPKQISSSEWQQWEVLFSLVTGGTIGAALASLSGWYQGSRAHMLRGLLLGALLGAVGGLLGLSLGGGIAHSMFGPRIFDRPGLSPSVILARTLAFAPFGAMIGLVVGASARSLPRAIQGAIGGLIGGALGGVTFDFLGASFGSAILAMRNESVGEVGQISRAVAMTAIGGFVGLFIGIVERLSRKAWVRLEVGRNEGKEWIVDAPRTFLGRSETAHIPLFGDPNIAPMHACIERRGDSYLLLDAGTPIGIGVNGVRVQQAVLNHGDVIQIGSYNLRFLLKNPRAAAAAPQASAPATPATPTHPTAPTLPTQPAPQSEPTVAIRASTPQALSYVLVAVDGPAAGQRFALSSPEVLAGRESNQISLAGDAAASRRHALFVVGPQGVSVRDLNSTNGTFVNGAPVQEMRLRPGDTIRIGSTTFRLEQGSAV